MEALTAGGALCERHRKGFVVHRKSAKDLAFFRELPNLIMAFSLKSLISACLVLSNYDASGSINS